MKQILHTFLASCLWVIVGLGAAQAQSGQVHLHAVSGQALTHVITSSPQRPMIQVQPNNGLAYFQSSGTRLGQAGTDVLEYIGNTGFYGTDTLLLVTWTTVPYPHMVRTNYIITVGPSIVTAADDYTATAMGQTVAIDVLANDSGTFGNLEITAVTLVTNGTAGIQSDEISFTPAAGFRGNATLSYSVCDLLNVCDVATATITVYDPNPTSDTLHIQVPRNGEQVVLIDEQGYPLVTPPSDGQLLLGMPKIYRPDLGYLGTDEIKWQTTIGSTTYTKLVSIEVLDVAPVNQFAVDDAVFTSKNTTAYIDARSNDVQGSTLSGFAIHSGPTHGTASVVNGVIVYTPNAPYLGPDQIIYRVFPPGYSGPAEYGTIDIMVNDLPPALFDFYLQTPKNTPLVVDYPIPFTNYAFGISSPVPLHGSAAFFASVDTTLSGYNIVGERLLVYNPTTDFVGTDLVRANYCITSTGNCIGLNIHVEVLDLTPPAGGWCVQQCVWPGDTDNNGFVELADLLPIGECLGAVGLQRTATSPFWTGLDAPSWTQQGMPASDLKFIDADGDGVIAAADTMEIMQNLGRYHKPYPEAAARIIDLPILIDFPFDTLYEGDLAYFNIILGTENHYAEDAYGFTYDLGYNTNLVLEGSQKLTYDDGSWLNYATPSLHLEHEPEFGVMSTAFTLTNGQPRTGYGRVAQFEFIVEEDLLGFRPEYDDPKMPRAEMADFSITHASVSSGGVRSQLPATTVRIPVMARPEHMPLRNRDLVLSPNPTAGPTRIHLNGADHISSCEIFNELGALVTTIPAGGNDLVLNTQSLARGIYTVRVTADGHTLHQKLVVQ